MNTEKITWYAARSGGIVAWCLLALGIILGLLLSSRLLGRRLSPAWTLSIHRHLGGLSVVFTAVHVGAIMLDDFVDFGLKAVLVPWASTWRPGAVAWGIVAMYLMVAIELTSFAMRRLPKRLWRAVHWSSAPLFVVATIHGYQAGTDVGRAFVVATVGVIAILVGLTATRVARARRDDARQDPRELLDRAKGRPKMRPLPPEHVLESLTLATRPARELSKVRVETDRVPAGVGASPSAAGAASGRPTSLEDALPAVPDAPLFDEALVPAGNGAPRSAAGDTFFDALAAAPPSPDSVMAVSSRPAPPPKHRVPPPPAMTAPTPPTQAAPTAPPAPPVPARVRAPAAPTPLAPTAPAPPTPLAPTAPAPLPPTAPLAPTPPAPLTPTAPAPPAPPTPSDTPARDWPAWGEVLAPRRQRSTDRRPGPAPGVWKRSAGPITEDP